MAILAATATLIDLRTRRLPFAFTAMCYSSFAFTVVLDQITKPRQEVSVSRALYSALIVVSCMLLVALALPGQLGLGDVLFAGFPAASLGYFAWSAALGSLLTAFVIQAVAIKVAKAIRLAGELTSYPLAPALAISWAVGVAILPS